MTGPLLIKELKRLRANIPANGDIFQGTEIVGYEILESGVEAEEQYTLVGRRFKDGTVQAAFIFGKCLECNQVAELAQQISPEFWIKYSEEDWQ